MSYINVAMKEYILPVRDLVVHPGLTVPVYIDNPLSIACIEAAATTTHRVVLAAQHSWNYPAAPDDLYNVGTIGDIAQVLRMPDGAIHAIIRTTAVVKLSGVTVEDGVFSGDTREIPIADDIDLDKTIALRDRVAENMQTLSATRRFKIDKLRNIVQNYPLPAFVDAVIQMADIDTDTAITVLCAGAWRDKLVLLLEQINLDG